ncbi:MAG: Adenylate kinase [uncultured bacterium]|uniref:Adenylate kinase n=4 Tax=Candidatus Daviesiibacteriota TaxID=1752718 RepID=A0A0G0EU36_9BACT|nr:MAG: Adenylate kinase [uncultured bacterium]KKQ10418.1 MAG: Adenylate kinase [Candidatus Daviesbacteria bacterium GW2011_GWB1_36_5]KKQ15798.1 MAG: Adenylate kinase [Candidatus Daviesbacteria bacterium GW2011_GWA1_36_8]
MMKIYVAGLPGSGKTTQTEKLGKYLNLPVAQMGVILRKIAVEDGEKGEMMKQVMSTGQLLSDEEVAQIMGDEVSGEEYKDGFVMEGFPRTEKQVELFNPDFDKVIYLEVSEDALVKRLLGRGRMDDSEEAIKKRMEVQKAGFEQVLGCYRDKLVKIDGEQSVDKVFESIVAHLKDES